MNISPAWNAGTMNEESFLSGLDPDEMDEDFDGQLVF